MRVLLLTPELLSIGGIQRQNRLLIAALDELLADGNGSLRVLALNDPPPKHFAPELSALRTTSISCFGGNRPAYIWQSLSESRKADLIVYGLLGFTLMSFAHMALRPSVRRLLVLHGIEAWHRRSFWHALAVRNMHGYISVSHYTLDRFRSAYRIGPSECCFILPNVVSPHLLSDNLVGCAGRKIEPRLLTVGRMHEHDRAKGIDTVLRALPALVTQFPELRYTIIGDGPDRPYLERLAQQLRVEQQVEFLGYVSEDTLRKAYLSCTIFVLPSVKEGFGFVYIEAMAYGKPVVAARAAATPEVVSDGKTGILVEYGDVPRLTDAIATLLSDPDLCRQMGRAGLDAVKTRFSYEALKTNLLKILTTCGCPLR